GWTGLLASRHNFALLDPATLLVRRHMRRLDALRAIGALLHHAAGAHGDIGIVRGLARLVEATIVVPIEAAHLVRAVAGAGARADAAVVDHLIEPSRAVHGGVHRAAHLARRLLAVHAGYRLEIAARIFNIPGVVTIHAQPQHFTTLAT